MSDYWDNICKAIDVKMSGDMSNFLEWKEIQETMFCEADIVELITLQQSNWGLWREALKENPYGKPRPYPAYLPSSGNMIHHAYLIDRFLQVDLTKINHVLELGGGYGSLCRLFYNLGYTGKYKIIDLPTFSTLQRIYLENIGHLPKLMDGQITLTTDTETKIETDLFIAMSSLSETPREFRDNILNKIKFKKALIIFYREWHGDNVEYFNDFIKRYTSHSWKLTEIEHLPGNYALVGDLI
jgi:hypothetical protein